MQGVRPRPGLPPEPTGPLLDGRERRTASLKTSPLHVGGRRRPWTRRPAVLLSFQGTPPHFAEREPSPFACGADLPVVQEILRARHAITLADLRGLLLYS
jgi:hypothetical protein